LSYCITHGLLFATLCFSQSNEAKTAIEKYSELPKPVKNTLLAAIKKPANNNVWVCEAEGIIAAIAVKTVPPKNTENYNRLHLLYVSQTHAESFAAMCEYIAFKEKSLLPRFGDRELLLMTLKRINISGSVKGAFHKTQTIGREVITTVYCPSANIKASLSNSENIKNIEEQYLQAGYNKIKEALAKNNHQEVIKTWKHLKSSDLFSPQLVVDIAGYYKNTDSPEECIRHCKEYGQYYKDIKSKEFFISLGDILADIQDEEAESLANSFYDRVEELCNTGNKIFTKQ
jgi:hypothetical protein